MFAGFIEIGADELAGAIDDTLDASGDRAAINVAVEHAHENRNARQWQFTKLELLRRDRADNLADPAVGRRHHEPLADRRYPRRIAKKISTPQCRDHADPAERWP